VISIEAVKESQANRGPITFKPSLNKSTGKMSTTCHSFNEPNCGAATRYYYTFARKLTPERFLQLMEMASATTGAKAMPGRRQSVRPTIDVDRSGRPNLVDLCEDDNVEEDDDEDGGEDDNDDDDGEDDEDGEVGEGSGDENCTLTSVST
jgi:hypothetical protein